MTNHAVFFQAYDPLRKSDFFLTKEDEFGLKSISVRPVWIIRDLEILYGWMNAPLRKSNWKINTRSKSLFRHYKQILLSENAQSIIIEQNQFPSVQFDILPMATEGWPSRIDYDGRDYCFHFLFGENFRYPDLFIRALGVLIESLLNFTDIHFLYVKLLQPDSRTESDLNTAGFEPINSFTVFGKRLPIYRIMINQE